MNKKQRKASEAPTLMRVGNKLIPNNKGTSQVKNTQKKEIVALSKAGATPAEIAMLLDLRETQVMRQLQNAERSDISENVAVSVQTRQNVISIDKRMTEKAAQTAMKVVGRIAELVEEENDISKLSTALKVLQGIADSGEVKTEITSITTRLRAL